MKGKILFPTDFSTASRDAFELAYVASNLLVSPIDVLYTIPLSAAEATLVYHQGLSPKVWARETWAREQMELFLRAFPNAAIGQEIIECSINIHQSIADLANRENYELIILGKQFHWESTCVSGKNMFQLLQEQASMKVIRSEEALFAHIQEVLKKEALHQIGSQ